jgi:hypothetical protein
MATLLEQLRSMTTVVADTGDINSIQNSSRRFHHQSLAHRGRGRRCPPMQPIVDDVLMQAREQAGSPYAPIASDKTGRRARLQVPRRRLRQARSSPSSPAASPPRSTRASPTTPRRPSPGPRHHRPVRPRRHRPRARPHQDRLHLGGHQGRRSPGEGRHPLQPHPALRPAPGHRLRRGQGHPHLALRR